MGFTCEKCGWWADVNGVCVCGYSGRPTTRHDSCTAWKTSIVTNADRIRSMTDEELANMWWSYVDCGECPKHRECKMTGQDCLRLALEWLREEVKE